MTILNAQGRPIADQALIDKITADLKAFGEWQATQNDGKGLLMQSLDGIARSSVLSIVKGLPLERIPSYLDFFFAALQKEIEQVVSAKQSEERIRQSLSQH